MVLRSRKPPDGSERSGDMRMHWTARKQLLLLLALALGLRLAAGLYWQSRHPDGFGMGDSDGYFTLGRAIAEGRPYEYGPYGAQNLRGRAIRCCWRRCSGSRTRTRSWPPGWKTPCWARWRWRAFGGWRGNCSARGRHCWRPLLAALYPESVAASALILSDTPFCA